MESRGDGYARLTVAGIPRVGRLPSRPDGILFIDCEADADIRTARELPSEYLAGARQIVLRYRDKAQGGLLREILLNRECHAAVWLLSQQPGDATRIVGVSDETPADAPALARRCRQIEVLSLLDWGGAIWEPERFHFSLPSGAHASQFIRLADALRDPRDAEVLAEWLLPFMSKGCGIVVDTGTLTALLLALRLRMSAHDWQPGNASLLERYPNTFVDIAGAFLHSLRGGADRILCVVSVTSTGALRALLAHAARLVAPRVKQIDVVSIVDLASYPGKEPTKIDGLALDSFARLRMAAQPSSGACALCSDPERSTVVPIDVRSFDALFPTLVRREMPAVISPQRSRLLWEHCKATGAIQFEAAPDLHVQKFRPASQKLAIKIDIKNLLKVDSTTLGKYAAERLRVALDKIEARNSDRHPHPSRFDWKGMDLVLFPRTDYELPGFDAFWKEARTAFTTEVHAEPVDPASEWTGELRDKVRQGKKILTATLGVVTGTTLQQMLFRVQTTRQDANYEVFGVAFNARPSRLRSWETLRNSFAFRLVSPWLTLLPEWSPFRDEQATLKDVDGSQLSPNAQEFLRARLLLCQGSSPTKYRGILWGGDETAELSSHSIFGHRLDAATTFVAVGSAVHSRREEASRSPERIVFDIPAIARSYYDTLIFCSILRWLRTDEMWWGEGPTSASQVVHDVLDRSDEKQRQVVAAELILSAAQRKLPRGADEVAQELCPPYLTDHPAWELGKQLIVAREAQSK